MNSKQVVLICAVAALVVALYALYERSLSVNETRGIPSYGYVPAVPIEPVAIVPPGIIDYREWNRWILTRVPNKMGEHVESTASADPGPGTPLPTALPHVDEVGILQARNRTPRYYDPARAFPHRYGAGRTASVPEPATVWLMLAGLVVMGVLRRGRT